MLSDAFDVTVTHIRDSHQHVLKVAGDRREELRWERELEWRHKKTSSPGNSRTASPTGERRPFPELKAPGLLFQLSNNPKDPIWCEWFVIDDDGGDDEETNQQKNSRTRRKSRIGRQHSYDDEVKVKFPLFAFDSFLLLTFFHFRWLLFVANSPTNFFPFY